MVQTPDPGLQDTIARDPLTLLIEQAVDRAVRRHVDALAARLTRQQDILSCDVAEAVRRTDTSEPVIRRTLREHPELAMRAGAKYLVKWSAFETWWLAQEKVKGDERPRPVPLKREAS